MSAKVVRGSVEGEYSTMSARATARSSKTKPEDRRRDFTIRSSLPKKSPWTGAGRKTPVEFFNLGKMVFSPSNFCSSQKA